MKVGIQSGKLLSWHRAIHHHPIFDSNYARENLASLIETLFMLYMYLALAVLVLHFSVLHGFLEHETLTWLIVELSARKIMLNPSDAVFFDKTYVLLAFGLTLLATFFTRISFNLAKARLHPGAMKKARQFKIVPGGRVPIEVVVLNKINQFRKEVKNAKNNQANNNPRASYRHSWWHKAYSDG